MSRYAKAIMAFFTALSAWGVTAAADGNYDQVELWGLCGVVVAAVGVYAIPNTPPGDAPRDPDMSEQDPNL